MRPSKLSTHASYLLPVVALVAATLPTGAQPQKGNTPSQDIVQTGLRDPVGRGSAGSAPRGNFPGGRGTGPDAGASRRQGPPAGPHGGPLPPSARISPRVHVPIAPNSERDLGPQFGRADNFHGRDFARLNTRELSAWRGGVWRHEQHAGYLGWWWVVGGFWYFYPEPVYPYPAYISDYLVPVPMPISPQYWYYCDDPPGYYPDVQACYDSWQMIPVTPSPPVSDVFRPGATAEVRAGYRIARAVCSTCHIVQPAQSIPPVLVQAGPSFVDVANRPDSTVDSLRNFISSTGWDMQSRPITMPNQRLSDQSTREVAIYIMSLRAPPH